MEARYIGRVRVDGLRQHLIVEVDGSRYLTVSRLDDTVRDVRGSGTLEVDPDFFDRCPCKSSEVLALEARNA